MYADRVRIIHADGSISVADLAFSQVTALLKDVSREERSRFWKRVGGSIHLPTGDRVWLVKEGV